MLIACGRVSMAVSSGFLSPEIKVCPLVPEFGQFIRKFSLLGTSNIF